MTARADILARLRAARATAPGVVPRDYDRAPVVADLIGVFVDRLADYRAGVHRTGSDRLPEVLAGLLPDNGVLVVPPGLPADWLAGRAGPVRRDGTPGPLSVTDLAADGVSVLTGCAVGVARTGTIVLDCAPDQGRRLLTLVPDHHVCVVRATQVTAGLPGALARLADPTRPLTFVSGPSATSDIELTRVEGVHGPRRLDVVVVDDR
ncbi:LutC/YkgG family protein [Micromonospora echinofusca]|uniref:Lactate utilization protein C n=1 Tax=Micromonospora echinofusca TaxID=47858 RepID=A0ABS3VLG2_MICEH|nr:LUD domain-containing protein [Micromonospora echinofusca]MBO4205278.1 lactate utilization protein C [Micromonospora echinofusca]